MSTWTDRFRGHGVWAQLELLGPALDQAAAREELEPQAAEAIGRLRYALTFIGGRLAAADPALVHIGPLDNIANTVQSATNEVQQFIANGTIGHLVNANSHADTALANVATINVPSLPDDLRSLREAAEHYRKTIEAALRSTRTSADSIQEDLEALKGRLSELASDVGAEKQRVSSVASDQQGQFSAAQDQRAREFADAHTARQDRFAKLIEDYTQKLADYNSEFKSQRDTVGREHESTIKDLTEQFKDRAATILSEIDEHRVQVEKLVGVIGNLGLTAGYQKAATEARNTSRLWQAVTVLSLGALIWIAYQAFLPMVGAQFTWPGFATRALILISIGALAAYAASQADKYLHSERRNRKLALELEALGPFLAPLPDAKQEEFRLAVGDRSFGREDLGPGKSDRSPATGLDVVIKSKELREFVAEIVRAAK